MFTYVPIHSGSATDQPLGWSSPELKSTAGKNPLETTSFTSTYRVSCQINKKHFSILPSLESWLARILWAYARITSVDHQWVGKHMSAGRLLLPQGVYWDHHPVSMCWSNPNSTYRHLQTTDRLFTVLRPPAPFICKIWINGKIMKNQYENLLYWGNAMISRRFLHFLPLNPIHSPAHSSVNGPWHTARAKTCPWWKWSYQTFRGSQSCSRICMAPYPQMAI